MLSETQITKVWEQMLEAEARSLYFADLASMYSRKKQWITGSSFFLASGAAATAIGTAPAWVPIVLSSVTALANAYSMAVGLDRKIGTLSKLYAAWNRIAVDYDRLWNHAYEDDAERQLSAIVEREKEPSELAVTEAPNDQELLGKWQDHVFKMYHLAPNG